MKRKYAGTVVALNISMGDVTVKYLKGDDIEKTKEALSKIKAI